jgi:hypothetical protein
VADIDEHLALELALGSLVVQYGQLTFYLRLAVQGLLNDPDQGRIVADGVTDARLEDLWFKLAMHRTRGDDAGTSAVRGMNNRLRQLMKARSGNVHGSYILLNLGLDTDADGLERVRINVAAGGLKLTSVDVDSLKGLLQQCQDLREEFVTRFVPLNGAPYPTVPGAFGAPSLGA